MKTKITTIKAGDEIKTIIYENTKGVIILRKKAIGESKNDKII